MKFFNIRRSLTALIAVLGLTLAVANNAYAKKKLHVSKYWKTVESFYKTKRVKFRVGKKAAGRFRAASSNSMQAEGEIITVEGKAKGFTWDRKEKSIHLVLFISAADDFGIAIQNLKPGDKVKVVSASGMASFDDAKAKKEKAGSIIGGVADVAAAVKPEFKNAIEAAEKLAKTLINVTLKDKNRDAFGRKDTGGKHPFARQEGGVLISLPAAQGPYYSSGKKLGLFGGKGNWIKGDGKKPRHDKYLPKHVKDAFFLVRGDGRHMNRRVRANGTMFVYAWDHKFKDNSGMYRVELQVTQGEQDGAPPVVNSKKPRTSRNRTRGRSRARSIRRRR